MFQKIVLWLLLLSFCVSNYRIIKNDIRIKKIPNTYIIHLIYVAIGFYGYILFSNNFLEIYTTNIIVQFIIVLVIWFALHYLNMWWGGDVKYVLILGLFIPHIWYFPLLTNIAIVTLVYIAISMIFFWGRKIIFFQEGKKIIQEILWDIRKYILEEQIRKKSLLELWQILTEFLLIFIILRLCRIYIWEKVISEQVFLTSFLFTYAFYAFILLCISLWVGIYYLRKRIIWYIKNSIEENSSSKTYLRFCYIYILSSMIYLEYLYAPYDFGKYLFLILTLYISLYLMIRSFWYLQKLAFRKQETFTISHKELKKGMIIEVPEIETNEKVKEQLAKIKGKKIGRKEISFLKKHRISNIRIQKFFSFSPHIFIWFVITCIIKKSLLGMIISLYLEYYLR